MLIRQSQREIPHREEDKQRGGSSVKMAAEIRVMQSKAKQCLKPPEAGRARNGISSRAFRVSMTPPKA